MSTYPIVGVYYRKPAPTLLNHIGVGTRLRVVCDDANEHDVNAIAVILPQASLPPPSDSLLSALAGYGIDGDAYAAFDDFHVGYVPREVAAALRARGFADCDGTFAVTPSGKPLVRLSE